MYRTFAALSAAALLAAPAPSLGQAEPEILRKSVGARLNQLTKTELEPFPAASWDTLADWTNGSALSPAVTDGQVVLIVTWAAWNRQSTTTLGVSQRLHESHEGDGLIVRRGFSRPPSFHDERLRNAPVGYYVNVETNGFGAMSGTSKLKSEKLILRPAGVSAIERCETQPTDSESWRLAPVSKS